MAALTFRSPSSMRLALLACTVLGCGGPSTSVKGSVTGVTLNAQDCMTLDGSESGEAAAPQNSGVIVIASDSGICNSFMNNAANANTNQLILIVYENDSNGNPQFPGTGTYTINNRATPPASSAVALAFFDVWNGTCQATPGKGGTANSGSVTLQQINLSGGGGAQGTFDLQFGADHITGSFNGSFCDAQNGQMSQSCNT
jgi:hypothetical protein